MGEFFQRIGKNATDLVLRQLDAASVLRAGATCKWMHALSQDELLWRWLVQRDFGFANVTNAHQVYREEFDFKGLRVHISSLKMAIADDSVGLIKWLERRGYYRHLCYPFLKLGPRIIAHRLFEHQEDTTFNDCEAFRHIAIYGRLEQLEVFLKDPRIDPTIQKNCALQTAIMCGRYRIVEALLADPRVRRTVRAEILKFSLAHFGHNPIGRSCWRQPRFSPDKTKQLVHDWCENNSISLL